MATADEDSASVILYLSPEPHHLPSISAVQSANSVSDMSVELSNCDALPASSVPLQSSVVSPLMLAGQDVLQCSDDVIIVESQFGVKAECVDRVTEHCPSGYDVTENAFTTEATALRCQNVGQSKVSDFILFCVIV